MEKAYKLLAKYKELSNKKSKELIDKGLVYIGDKKVKIARAEVSEDTKFRIIEVKDIKIIYEDNLITVVDKPAMIDSYDVKDKIKGVELLHRLDRDTSGVLVLVKDKDFLEKAIKAFKNRNVVKKYISWVEGVIYEEIIINTPITTHKKGGSAFSTIDKKNGRPAITIVKPLEVQGKKSKIEIEIKTGRTHQIRVHLASIGHSVIGDEKYGSFTKSVRFLLHAKSIQFLEYSFEAIEPKDIQKYK